MNNNKWQGVTVCTVHMYPQMSLNQKRKKEEKKSN